jgi:hypothetical protein
MMRSLVIAAIGAGSFAGVGCGSGGQLSGAGGAGQIQTGAGGIGNFGGGNVGGVGTGAITGMNCAAHPTQPQPLPPDIVIVLDTSSSMNDAVYGPCGGTCPPTKWSSAVAAIDSIVGAATPKVHWGLKLIADGGEACDAGGITVPTGTDSAGQIRAVLAQRTSGNMLATPGNTPLRAAIEVAAAHLSGRDPGPLRTILLITDGLPDCKPGEPDPLASDASGAVQAVSDAAAAGVTTYVVGVGTLAADADAALDQLAVAGGLPRAGTPAYAPAAGSADLTTAINDLVTQAAACTFAVPDPPTTDGTTSREDIDVFLRGFDMGDVHVPQDAMNGWGYTDQSAMGIQLRGSACDEVRGGRPVSIVFPCHD